MEKRKYNRSLDNMQIFALKNAELNEIRGGHSFGDFMDWFWSLFSSQPNNDDDGNNGHGGGPK